jgi:hypothetical protein
MNDIKINFGKGGHVKVVKNCRAKGKRKKGDLTQIDE